MTAALMFVPAVLLSAVAWVAAKRVYRRWIRHRIVGAA